MSIFSGPKNKDELILVFDIGSSSVGGALFWTQESGIPKIIFSTREPIPTLDQVDINRFLLLTIQSLEIVVKKIYMAKMGAPSQVFCILSSPWYVSQTRIINFKKNTPFVFTTKLADSLIQKEIKLFGEEHLDKYKDIVNPFRTIELKNIKTTLNGYETSKPLNKKAQELEMALFISMSGEQVLRKIEDAISKHFHFNKIKFSSFAMASFTVVRDMYTKQGNFLLVDIGGEVTDISMIKKNILRESLFFPLGSNFLIRGIASNLNCKLSEAKSLFSLFKDEHAEESTKKKLSLILNQLRIEWLKKFQESLANLSHDISIPATIYITLEKDSADFFSETIKTEQFSQYTLTESKFEVIILSADLFNNIAIFRELVIPEPFILIDSIYINRFLIYSILNGRI
ncbi:MAG: hypothetical protein WC884_00615 [Candidatus Paceibacterota bacterium]